MTDSTNNILLLGGENPTTWIVYNELVARFGLFPALVEKPISRWSLIRNRMRKLGFVPVLSQVAFAFGIRPFVRRKAAPRIKYLKRLHGLEAARPVSDLIFNVDSVNGVAAHELIERLGPKIVIVNGTRILNGKTLAKLNATVINTHQGITPAYRGAHGAYWALAQGDKSHCGVTVHLVDEGIDTGAIIAQAVIAPDAADNFASYPYLQTAKALELVADAIAAAEHSTLKTVPISGASQVWYHPGLFQYLGNALRGVR